MAKKFKLTIATRDKKITGEVDSITLPSEEGELTILADHIPLMGKLTKGRIHLLSQDIRFKQGFFQFKDNHAIILVDN